MPLDRQARLLLDTVAAMNLPDLSTLAPGPAREMTREQRSRLPPGPPAQVTDLRIPVPRGTVSARLYRPESAGDRVLPLLLWFHGGGFVIGSVAESDPDARRLATDAGISVLSVEYGLAPEHRFPTGAEDCYAATAWAAANAERLDVDATRIAVGGDSAGGNLATVVALMARDRGGPNLAFQLLVYPVTDFASLETPSHHENADGYFLTRSSLFWFREHYLPDPAVRRNGYASPLHATRLDGLPPALLLTAEFDPLRDEGEAYGERLRAAGVSVTVSRYDGMIHGFFSMAAFLEGGKRATAEAVSALRAALG
ncbi:MAG TPA: alpha/beta hydrolase [Polyangiaceae bacterium]|nr:alpha/beta hydrolase [Polyangiaceae bacterium]